VSTLGSRFGYVPGCTQRLRDHTKEKDPVADIAKYVDKQFEGMDFAQIADQPVSALQGISAGDAELLQKAFNVRTIRQFAELKFVKAAQAITLLAGAR
jgi:hypothetical protein